MGQSAYYDSQRMGRIMARGMQVSLYRLSGGKIFNVEETHCIARSDPACTVLIDQRPIS